MAGMALRHAQIAALVSREGVMAHAYAARTWEGKVDVRRAALLAILSHFPGRGRQLGVVVHRSKNGRGSLAATILISTLLQIKAWQNNQPHLV